MQRGFHRNTTGQPSNPPRFAGGNFMKTVFAIILLGGTLATSALARDHSADYKIGTFISVDAVADGTITSTLHGDGTTVAGDVYTNHIAVYRIKVADGTWNVTTLSQN